jgi:hypothetical protein
LDQVGGPDRQLVRRRCSAGLAAHGTTKTQVTHQALDGAPGDHDPLAVELTPDLASAVDAEVRGVDPGDLGLQGLVTQRTGRRRPGSCFVVRRRGDRQQPEIGSTPKVALFSSM